MRTPIFLLSLTAVLSLLTPMPAMAADTTLRFKNETKDIRTIEVLDFLKGENLDPAAGYGVATADLNGDGVDEWIVREDKDPTCADTAACRFFVVALKNKAPHLLTKLYAGNIGLLDQKLYGVRSLAVYNKPQDDFSFARYHWKPELGTFSPN